MSESSELRDHILVVDDDATIRILVRSIISRALPNFHTIEAASPDQALAKIIQSGGFRIARVLTDHEMPDMKGLDFVGVLRGKEHEGRKLPQAHVEALQNTPIALMSTHTHPEFVSAVRSLLADGSLQHYIAKDTSLISGLQKVLPLLETGGFTLP